MRNIREGDYMMKYRISIMTLIFWCILMKHPAEALCINVMQAHIRSGPGRQYPLVWDVYKYMPFEKVGRSLKGNWYAVKDVDGDVSWLHAGLVSDAFRCAVVKKKRANVRTGPSTRYRKASWSPAGQYESFRVQRIRGSWVKVKDAWNNSGWIHKGLLWVR